MWRRSFSPATASSSSDGINYLLPRDVPAVAPAQETFLKRQSVSFAELLLDLRGRGARVSLAILDACRDDPFAERAGNRWSPRAAYARWCRPRARS